MCVLYSLSSPRAALPSRLTKLLYILLCHSSALLYLHARVCFALSKRSRAPPPVYVHICVRRISLNCTLPCHTGRMIGFEFILKIFLRNNKRGTSFRLLLCGRRRERTQAREHAGYTCCAALTHFIIKLVLHIPFNTRDSLRSAICHSNMGTAHTKNMMGVYAGEKRLIQTWAVPSYFIVSACLRHHNNLSLYASEPLL